MKRRKFLKLMATGTVGAAVLPSYAAFIEPVMFDVCEVTLPLRRLGPGLNNLRAAQISDIHIGPWFTRRRLESAIRKVIEQQPELVFITGDYLTLHGNHPKMRSDLYEPLRELARTCPVFSVLGNHDQHEGLGGEMLKMLQEAGVEDVTNTYGSYQRGGETLYIAGVGTLSTGHMELVKVSKEVPRDSAVIMLAHEPDVAQWTNEFPHYILQLSGHTHGGQIVNPFTGEPASLPWMGKMYPAGLYELSEMVLYTNRGLGMTHVPFRINCPPEITMFTFQQAGS
jgi:uncharacterized protein